MNPNFFQKTMIKNILIKRLISNTIFQLFSCINKKVNHHDEYILLYSNQGFRDNIKSLYCYLIEKGYNNKYKIICSTNDYKQVKEKCKNVKFISNIKGIFYYFKCKHVYYCFGKLPIIPHPLQIVIQMWHGTPFKAADKSMQQSHSKLYYTYIFSASKHFIPIVSSIFSFPQERVLVCGHPRTDILVNHQNIHYDFGDYNKLIVWAPTFRKSSILGYEDSHNSSIIPIFKPEELIDLEMYLKQKKVKLVIKLHPVQDLSSYNLTNMEYLILLSHQEFVRRNMELYSLLKQSDALITDYSSVFYDYLLLNRPLAFTEDDINEYSHNRGYAMSNPNDYKPGYKIRTKDNFLQFINDMANNIDTFQQERLKVNKLANDYTDGENCKRALTLSNITLTNI